MLFADLAGTRHIEVNLNEEGIRWRNDNRNEFPTGNPLLNSKVCQRMVNDLHRRLNVDWSYGGYLEQRNDIWEGNFLENGQRFLHLGVDFNVPAGIPVAASKRSRLRYVDGLSGGGNDHWGTRVILESLDGKDPLLMMAHLSAKLRKNVGDVVNPSEAFAEIGSPENEENGGWYAHLHLQAVTRKRFEALLKRDPALHNLNGYARSEELKQVRKWHPNPLPYVTLPE